HRQNSAARTADPCRGDVVAARRTFGVRRKRDSRLPVNSFELQPASHVRYSQCVRRERREVRSALTFAYVTSVRDVWTGAASDADGCPILLLAVDFSDTRANRLAHWVQHPSSDRGQ